MSDFDDLPLSKKNQLDRATTEQKRVCPNTGLSKRSCKCPKCMGARNRRKGQRAQREVRKGLQLNHEKWRGREGNEETWTAAVRVEVKSGKQVQPVATRYVAARQQSDAAKPIGDARPFVFVARPEGSQALVVVRIDELQAVVEALVAEWTDTT